MTAKPAKNIWIIDLTHGKIQAVAHPFNLFLFNLLREKTQTLNLMYSYK